MKKLPLNLLVEALRKQLREADVALKNANNQILILQMKVQQLENSLSRPGNDNGVIS